MGSGYVRGEQGTIADTGSQGRHHQGLWGHPQYHNREAHPLAGAWHVVPQDLPVGDPSQYGEGEAKAADGSSALRERACSRYSGLEAVFVLTPIGKRIVNIDESTIDQTAYVRRGWGPKGQ